MVLQAQASEALQRMLSVLPGDTVVCSLSRRLLGGCAGLLLTRSAPGRAPLVLQLPLVADEVSSMCLLFVDRCLTRCHLLCKCSCAC